jgi:hypothetical protein
MLPFGWYPLRSCGLCNDNIPKINRPIQTIMFILYPRIPVRVFLYLSYRYPVYYQRTFSGFTLPFYFLYFRLIKAPESIYAMPMGAMR